MVLKYWLILYIKHKSRGGLVPEWVQGSARYRNQQFWLYAVEKQCKYKKKWKPPNIEIMDGRENTIMMWQKETDLRTHWTAMLTPPLERRHEEVNFFFHDSTKYAKFDE